MKFDWRCHLLFCMRHCCKFHPFSSTALRKPYRTPHRTTSNSLQVVPRRTAAPRQRAQHSATPLWQRTRLGSVVENPSSHSTQKETIMKVEQPQASDPARQTTRSTKNKGSTEYCPRQLAFIGEPLGAADHRARRDDSECRRKRGR